MSKELIKQEQKPLVPTTSKELSEIYNPVNCARVLQGCNSIAKAMVSGTPSIGALVRNLGDQKVEAYIKLWLITLNETLDLKKPLSELQIDKIALRIVENYKNLNLADINLIFRRAELGDYGLMFDRISVPTVLKWFKDYFDERMETAAENSYQEHLKFKEARDVPETFQFLNSVKGAFSSLHTTAMENREKMEKAKRKVNQK